MNDNTDGDLTDDAIDDLLDAIEVAERLERARIYGRTALGATDELETTNGAWRSTGGTFYELPTRRFYSAEPPPFDPTKHQALTITIFGLLPWAASGSPATALKTVRTLRGRLDELEHEAVALARSYGWSWKDISEVLGTHRSALQRRFARPQVPPRERRSRRPR